MGHSPLRKIHYFTIGTLLLNGHFCGCLAEQFSCLMHNFHTLQPDLYTTLINKYCNLPTVELHLLFVDSKVHGDTVSESYVFNTFYFPF